MPVKKVIITCQDVVVEMEPEAFNMSTYLKSLAEDFADEEMEILNHPMTQPHWMTGALLKLVGDYCNHVRGDVTKISKIPMPLGESLEKNLSPFEWNLVSDLKLGNTLRHGLYTLHHASEYFGIEPLGNLVAAATADRLLKEKPSVEFIVANFTSYSSFPENFGEEPVVA